MGGAVSAVSKVAGVFGKINPYLQVASLAFQGYSAIQGRKSKKEAAKAEERRAAELKAAEEAKAREARVRARREMVAQERQRRIQTGRMTAATGGVGLGTGGTSSFTGAVGSIGTQAATNIGNISVAQGTADYLSQRNIAAGGFASQSLQAQAESTGWTQTAGLVQGMSGQISNIFGSPTIQQPGLSNISRYSSTANAPFSSMLGG